MMGEEMRKKCFVKKIYIQIDITKYIQNLS